MPLDFRLDLLGTFREITMRSSATLLACEQQDIIGYNCHDFCNTIECRQETVIKQLD